MDLAIDLAISGLSFAVLKANSAATFAFSGFCFAQSIAAPPMAAPKLLDPGSAARCCSPGNGSVRVCGVTTGWTTSTSWSSYISTRSGQMVRKIDNWLLHSMRIRRLIVGAVEEEANDREETEGSPENVPRDSTDCQALS
jgi:hypothetical protein